MRSIGAEKCIFAFSANCYYKKALFPADDLDVLFPETIE